MLPRRQKLSRKSFPSHKEPKTTWRGVFLLFRYTYTKEQVQARFAVVVAKKTVPKATTRSKVKRMIYEYIRLHKGDFSKFEGAKIVITVQKTKQEINNIAVCSDMEGFFKK